MPAFISINQITSVNDIYPTTGLAGVTDKSTVNANMLRQFVSDSRFGGILFAGGIPNAALADIDGAKIVTLTITEGKIANNTISPSKLTLGSPVWNNLGKVGIGVATTQLKDKLFVNGVLRLKPDTSEGFAVGEQDASKTNTYIAFEPSSTTGTSDWAYLRDIGTSDELHVSLDLHDNGNGASGQRFSIRNVASTGNTVDVATSRFTIDINGNVGINQATPTQKLDVDGNIKGTTIFGTTSVEARNGDTINSSMNSAGQGYLSSSLGLGTSTIPTGARLVVTGGSIVADNTSGLRFNSSTANRGASITYDATNFRLSIATANSANDHLILSPSGRVGVKTTGIPGSELDVNGTINTLGLNINTVGATTGGTITLARPTTTSLAGSVQIQTIGNGVRFIDSNNSRGAYLNLASVTTGSTNEIVTDANISLKLRTNLVTVGGDPQTITGNKTFSGTVALPTGATVGGLAILTSGAVTNTFSSLIVGTQVNKATIQYTTNVANSYSLPGLPSGTTSTNLVVTNGNQTITGTLGVSAPTATGHAATRGYVDTAVSGLATAASVTAVATSVTTISTSVTNINTSLGSTYRYGGSVEFNYGANGQHTFTKASYTGLRAILVKAVGGGGGGGRADATSGSNNVAVGGSGGGGGYQERFILASALPASVTVSIGVGGIGGSTGNGNGGNGGDTTFGSFILNALGGIGGSRGVSGAASTYFLITGSGGGSGDNTVSGTNKVYRGTGDRVINGFVSRDAIFSPPGGNSLLGQGAPLGLGAPLAGITIGRNGLPPLGPGGGGGGGINGVSKTASRDGATGRTGIVIVDLFY